MDNNEAFLKAYDEAFENNKYEGEHEFEVNDLKLAKEIWQAAQQQSAGEIAELTEKLERKKSYALAITEAIIEKDMTINVLKADNERLRKALKEIAETNASTHGLTTTMVSFCIKTAKEALAKTPVQ